MLLQNILSREYTVSLFWKNVFSTGNLLTSHHQQGGDWAEELAVSLEDQEDTKMAEMDGPACISLQAVHK